jgi:hypothetical protein
MTAGDWLWSEWQDAALEAGMTPCGDTLLDPAAVGHAHLIGVVDGRPVDVRARTEAVVRTPFDPPFDLELSVFPEGTMPRRDLVLGDARFDRVFVVRGAEERRVREMLDARVRDGLVDLFSRSHSLALDDHALQVVGGGPSWLRWALPRAVELARRLDHGRARVSLPDALLAPPAALARFASDHLLRIEDTPVRLAGTTGAVSVQASLTARAGRPRLDARLRLAEALNLELEIEPQRMWTPLVSIVTGQLDHAIGDAAFDDAFRVRSRYPDEVGRTLDHEARALLQQCRRRSRSLQLSDHGLWLSADVDPAEPGVPAELLRVGVTLLERLHARVRSGPTAPRVGPFR